MKISRIQVIGNLIGIIPGVYLVAQILSGNLSANPIQTATVITGRTSVYAILFSLYCSPIARIFRLSIFHRIRKITGLFAFYYALGHFLVFTLFDYQFNFSWILPELKQKPFLQIGLIALVLLLLLAITSITIIRRKMVKSWKKVHYLVYLITALVLLHIAIASKGDLINPAVLILIYTLAMILRLPWLRSIKIKTLPGWLKQIDSYLSHTI